jgi:hypothetical protein
MAWWEPKVLAEMPDGKHPAFLLFRGKSTGLLDILRRNCLNEPQATAGELGEGMPCPKT